MRLDRRCDDPDKAPSAGQIMHKREKACQGLRGSAREECLGSYVGPEDKNRYGRDSIYASKYGGLYRAKPAKPLTLPNKPGRSSTGGELSGDD
jgi:hypothetical protein